MDWPIYVLIWIVCGIASLLIRQAKGDPDVTSAFVTGLVLGPIGILLALIGGEGTGPECVHCGKRVAKGRTRLCNNCGEPFAA